MSFQNPPVLKGKCPVCTFELQGAHTWHDLTDIEARPGGTLRTQCPRCDTELRVPERQLRIVRATMWWVILVVAIGAVASFFVEEPMHATFGILVGLIPVIPLIIMAAQANVLERVGEPHNSYSQPPPASRPDAAAK